MELLRSYFPELSVSQTDKFNTLATALNEWNNKVNVVSRKDIDQLETRHFLHSLAIAKFIQFKDDTKIVDIGTGGGFPGIPLAILFPECHFTLVDSIGKKIRVVEDLIEQCQLENVNAIHSRAEQLMGKYDFVVSRAVTALPKFYNWTKKLVAEVAKNDLPNGIIYLKGGDISGEVAGFGKRVTITPVSEWFREDWFVEKKVVHLRVKG